MFHKHLSLSLVFLILLLGILPTTKDKGQTILSLSFFQLIDFRNFVIFNRNALWHQYIVHFAMLAVNIMRAT